MIFPILDRFPAGRNFVSRLRKAMRLTPSVWCDEHGRNGIAVVCSHALNSYKSAVQGTFHVFRHEEDEAPMGFCDACSRHIPAFRGEVEDGDDEPFDEELVLVCKACFNEQADFFENVIDHEEESNNRRGNWWK